MLVSSSIKPHLVEIRQRILSRPGRFSQLLAPARAALWWVGKTYRRLSADTGFVDRF